MSLSGRVIHLHVAAPPKPDLGAPCNGCGVCCATVPCPLGMLLSRRRRGACTALRWDEAKARYTCGAVSAPAEVLPGPLRAAAPLLARLAPRWIAAGRGCDAALETSTPDPDQPAA